MNHNDKPPFEVSGKPKKSAIAGKYGLGYSTARHLARMAMKQVIDKSPEMKKYSIKKVAEAYTLPSASQNDHDHVKNQLSSVLGVRSSEEEKSSIPAVHRAIKKVSGINDTSTRKMSKAILRSLVQKHKIIVDKEHRQMLNQESADQVDEISSTSAYGRINARFKKLSGRSLGAAAKEHGDEAKRLQKEIDAQQAEIDRRKAAMKNEENLDELSKSTVKSYLQKKLNKPGIPSQKDVDGIANATVRLMGKKPTSEEIEQIKELKSTTLMSYKDKANKEIKSLDKEVKSGEYKDIAGKIMDRRMKGADRAANKLVARNSNAKPSQIGEESLTAGKRLISKHGEGAHTARVYKDTEYNEYQVHHYKDGKHMGEGPVSYHSDKEDAESTAKASLKQRMGMKEELEINEASNDLTKISTDKLKAHWNKHKDQERPSPTFAMHLKKVASELKKRNALKEEVEEIDELKKSTLASYVMKAADSAKSKKDAAANMYRFTKQVTSAMKKSTEGDKRIEGIKSATKRLAKEEVEEIEELNKSTLYSDISRSGNNRSRYALNTKNFPDREIGRLTKEENQMKTFQTLRTTLFEKTLTPAETKKREEVSKAIERDQPGMPMAKKMAIATATAKKVAEEKLNDMHYCAKHVYSDVFGEGYVIEGEHAEPFDDGSIQWYNVEFDHGVEQVFTEDVKVMFAEYHMNHKRNKMGESSKRKADVKETVKHPNQQVLDVHEPEKDKITAKDFEMLRKIKKNRTK